MRSAQPSSPLISFPPYLQLPDSYIYHVPNSPVVLKLQKEDFVPDRNEAEIETAIEEAVYDNAQHTDRQALISPLDDLYEYNGGGLARLSLYPYPEEDQAAALTWELWMDALKGIMAYYRAYPGLYFVFWIYLDSAAPGAKSVAEGVLITLWSRTLPSIHNNTISAGRILPSIHNNTLSADRDSTLSANN